MRRPNFFIIGAPKCGTTSLAMWLSEHPAIFISPIKEPHFFNSDERQGASRPCCVRGAVRQGRERPCGGRRGIGLGIPIPRRPDGTSWRTDPTARLIVMVRNPIEMAPAVHAQMLASGHENVRDFASAWALQPDRSAGRATLPPWSWSQRRLLYGEVCRLGAQLERLLTVVPRSQLLVLVLDDIAADPRREYIKALEFLGVPDDGRTGFPVYNRAFLPPSGDVESGGFHCDPDEAPVEFGRHDRTMDPRVRGEQCRSGPRQADAGPPSHFGVPFRA